MRLPAIPRSRPGASRTPRSERLAAVLAAGACLLIAGYLALNHGDQDKVRTASELAQQGRYDASLAAARDVARAPSETRALLVRARVAQVIGRHAAAIRLFATAAERDPRSWSLHRDWAISLSRLGRVKEATRRLEIAATLNPRMPRPSGF